MIQINKKGDIMSNKTKQPKPELEYYANNLSKYIKLCKINRHAFAYRLWTTTTTITSITNGHLKMPYRMAIRFKKLAEVMNVHVDLDKILPPDKWDIEFKKNKGRIFSLADSDEDE
jgi:hypothetical protein